MNNLKQKVVLTSFIICSLLVITTQGLAEPVVDSITFDPEMPKGQGSFTATVQITSEEAIEEVYFEVLGECNRTEGICYQGTTQNISLSQVEDTSTYQGTITLTHEKASYIEYQITVSAGGSWTSSEKTEIDLDTTPKDTNGDNGNGGTNGDNGNGGTNGDETPGFESIVLIGALIISLVALRKRRFR